MHIVNDSVTNSDGFFDGLHANGHIGNAGDRECLRHGTSGDRDVVVGELKGRLVLRGDGHTLLLVVHSGHASSNHTGLRKMTAKRHDCMAGFNRAGSNLGEEGLIGHIGKRVDDDHFGFVSTKQLLQFECRIEAGVSATDNDNASHTTPNFLLNQYLI